MDRPEPRLVGVEFDGLGAFPVDVALDHGEQVGKGGRGLGDRAPPLVDDPPGEVADQDRHEADVDLDSDGRDGGTVEADEGGGAADPLVFLWTGLVDETAFDQVGDEARHGGPGEAGDGGDPGATARTIGGEQAQDERQVVTSHVEVLDGPCHPGHGSGG